MMTFQHQLLAAVVAVLLLPMPKAQAVDVYTISNFVLAPGGASQSGSDCLVLSSALGQSVADLSSGANYDLDSGFWALLPITRDSIFSNGFENCGFGQQRDLQ